MVGGFPRLAGYLHILATPKRSLPVGRLAWDQHKPGNVVLQHREYVYAIELFEGSLEISREIGYQWGRAFSLEDLASCATMQGGIQRALTLAGAAEGIRYTIGILLSKTTQAVFDATPEPARQALPDQDAILAWDHKVISFCGSLLMPIKRLVRELTLYKTYFGC